MLYCATPAAVELGCATGGIASGRTYLRSDGDPALIVRLTNGGTAKPAPASNPPFTTRRRVVVTRNPVSRVDFVMARSRFICSSRWSILRPRYREGAAKRAKNAAYGIVADPSTGLCRCGGPGEFKSCGRWRQFKDEPSRQGFLGSDKDLRKVVGQRGPNPANRGPHLKLCASNTLFRPRQVLQPHLQIDPVERR